MSAEQFENIYNILVEIDNKLQCIIEILIILFIIYFFIKFIENVVKSII